MAVKIPSKLHTMSPTFQKAWYKRNKMELPQHLTGSVKQASKEVKPSERVKKLQTKSLQAYGATKGLKVGGEHGSGEMKDTIAPLTRDQHSKVQAAARAAKAAEKAAAAPKKPLTKDQRMAAIAAAVRKAQTKHDVPTMDPDDESHDDLRDLHQALHIRKGYNEEVEQIEEASPMIKPPTNRFDKKSDAFAHVKKHGGKVYKQTYTDSKGQQTVSYSVKKEEVELDEVSKAEAEKLLGGPVKPKPANAPAGKLPYGFRRARNLARQAMRGGVSAIHRSMEKTMQKENVTESTTEVSEVNEMSYGKKIAKIMLAKQSKHPIAQNMGEAVKDQADVGEYDYEGDMAKSQLRSILTNAKRLHDMLEDTTNLPEWVQSKITLAEDYILTAANYMEGEMNEEALDELAASLDEEIELFEKAPPGSKYERMVKHIKKGYAKGGLTDKERSIAYATAWKAHNKANEEVEQVDEKLSPFSTVGKILTRSKLRGKENRFAYIAHSERPLTPDEQKERSKVRKVGTRLGIDVTEEVEQVDEANMRFDPEAAARPKSSDVKNFQMRNTNRRASAASKKYIRRMTKLGGLGPNQTKKDTEAHMKAHFGEEVEQVEEKYENNPLHSMPRPNKAVGLKPSQLAKKPVTAEGADDWKKAFAKVAKRNLNQDTAQVKQKVKKLEPVDVTEGSVPTTPKEKELAKHHGDPNRITFGDVIKARLKSAAAKKMGK